MDLAVSLRMEVDHGMVQPLEILFGGLTAVPVVPFFINSVAPPFTPVNRVRALGEALGRYLSGLDKRVLLIGSGGLSHEPPVPTLETAPAHVVEGLIAGRHPTAEATAKRRANVIDAAKRFAAGEGNLKALNPDWDNTFLDQLAANDLDAIDEYTNDSIKEHGGQSGQEIRNWIAAYAALSTVGPYDITYRYYRPIPEFIAGFSVTTALPRTTELTRRGCPEGTPRHGSTLRRTAGAGTTSPVPAAHRGTRFAQRGRPVRRPPAEPSTSHSGKGSSRCWPWVSTTGGDPAGKRSQT